MAPVSMKKLITLQESRANEPDRILKRFKEAAKQTLTRNIVQKRLETVDKIWAESRDTHAEIISRDEATAEPYYTNEVFALMKDNFESLQNNLLRTLNDFDEPQKKNRSSLTSVDLDHDLDAQPRKAKLPKLDLPTFSGRYEDWEDFCDLFTSLVHDAPRLTNVTKLQYLKSCLTGTAADLVKDVSTTHANYESTWQSLKLRFSNPRLTVNNHLTALMDLPYLKQESAEELRAFSDEAQRIIRALTNLEMPVKHWDIWLVYILASRLDPESRKLWESDLSARDRHAVARAAESSEELTRLERFPSLHDFTEFLEQRSYALCMIAAENKTNKKPAPVQAKLTGNFKRSLHATPSSSLQNRKLAKRKCPLCSREHYIGACPSFLGKSTRERRNEERRLRLCFNCLGAHNFQNCESRKRCVRCREKHHSTLHNYPAKSDSAIQKPTESSNHSEAPENLVPLSNVTALTANLSLPKQSVILATAQVLLIGPRGREVRVRALLDQGSEASFVTESIAQHLFALNP